VTDFAEFYAARFHGLTVQLFAYTDDLALAQDVVQEAFCRAVPKWEKLREYDDPAAWVRRVAFNLAKSRWRRNRTARAFIQRHREEHVEGPTPDRVALTRALAELSEGQRRALILHYLAGLSISEIAEQCGAAEGTVKSWLYRGRAALAVLLADPEEARHV
jgi:RNA polymerase sigma-70 factor (ECF subfamily)